MSCQHGNNTQACDLCDALDAEYQSGYAAAMRKQQATIERLKGQRTELIRELKWTVAGLDDYYYDHAAEQVEATRALIAEIEAEK